VYWVLLNIILSVRTVVRTVSPVIINNAAVIIWISLLLLLVLDCILFAVSVISYISYNILCVLSKVDTDF